MIISSLKIKKNLYFIRILHLERRSNQEIAHLPPTVVEIKSTRARLCRLALSSFPRASFAGDVDLPERIFGTSIQMPILPSPSPLVLGFTWIVRGKIKKKVLRGLGKQTLPFGLPLNVLEK